MKLKKPNLTNGQIIFICILLLVVFCWTVFIYSSKKDYFPEGEYFPSEEFIYNCYNTKNPEEITQIVVVDIAENKDVALDKCKVEICKTKVCDVIIERIHRRKKKG